MGIAACELSQHVIRPTLVYLGHYSPAAEALLLGAAASQSSLCSELDDNLGHGLFRITEARHQQLWDCHLAFNPDLASQIRGLASQHAFLDAPHIELTVNLRYATAIAWMLIEIEHRTLPEVNDLNGMATIWRHVFRPTGRAQDFIDAWQRCIGQLDQVA